MKKNSRKNFSENTQQFLYDEVKGKCPLCLNSLTYEKNNKLYKDFLANNKEKNEKLKVIWIPCFEYLGHFIMNGESNEDI